MKNVIAKILKVNIYGIYIDFVSRMYVCIQGSLKLKTHTVDRNVPLRTGTGFVAWAGSKLSLLNAVLKNTLYSKLSWSAPKNPT